MSKLKSYQAFVAVVEEKSISKAANRLNLTSSAVSKLLSKLESDLEVRLVERTTKSLEVTDPGSKFYFRCQDILNNILEAEQSLKEDSGAETGKISLSLSKVLLKTPFLQLLTAFSETYPDLKLDLQITDENVDLIEDKVDFAFRIGPLNDRRIIARKLIKTKIVFCASPDYLSHHGTPTTVKALKDHELILPTYLNLSELMSKLFGSNTTHFNLQHFTTTNDFIALHEAVCAGMGISMVPDISIQTEIQAGELEIVLPNKTCYKKDLNLLYTRREYMPLKMQLFKAFIEENCRDYLDD